MRSKVLVISKLENGFHITDCNYYARMDGTPASFQRVFKNLTEVACFLTEWYGLDMDDQPQTPLPEP
jgi:hypothetical protein